jgi:hypothetical protein
MEYVLILSSAVLFFVLFLLGSLVREASNIAVYYLPCPIFS